MKDRKKGLYIVSAAILLLVSLQLASCSLIEGIGGILEGFQFGKPGSKETVSSDEITPVNDSDGNNGIEDDFSTEKLADEESLNGELYLATSADKRGMGNKIETEHYIFYFNDIDKNFLDTYVRIAVNGSEGLEIIFGEKLDKKIEIFLCENPEEFKVAAEGVSPPGFDGSEPAGQSVGGEVHMYKAEEFKPGPESADGEVNYRIALLHEIGHAYYFLVYPNAAKKNDWLNEALADKSITGEYIDPGSISNDCLKGLIAGGNFIPLAELESKAERSFGRDDDYIFSEYISFVNFISLRYGFEALHKLLLEYDSSKDLLTSLVTTTELDPVSFEEQWLDAIENGAS